MSFSASSIYAAAATQGAAKHFLLIVWDGMRPDFVTPELTPNLYQLREQGVWFGNHRSVYPTSTEVNGTVLATGMFPRRNGITANKEYRPEIDPLKQVGTEAFKVVRRGDVLTDGKYIRVPTVAELVQASGGQTAVVGAKPVALLHDRRERPADSVNPVWYANGVLPEALLDGLTNQLGAFPATISPNIARDTWATRCLTEVFWRKTLPQYSVLWLSEPDFSQHHHGPGSPQALAGIRSCDERLGTVLTELERRGMRQQTDLMIVSDHGFSTIRANADVAARLRAAGLNARSSWESAPQLDDIVVVGNGGSVLLYVIGQSATVIARAVGVLQQREDSGVIFTQQGLEGTFALSEVRLNSETAPDVMIASGWRISTAQPGHPTAEIRNDGYSEYAVGGGMHVTLSPTDLHNTAVFCGPDFRRGVVSPLPSGNVDIVPTLLCLMGLKPAQALDGRILYEALANAPGVSQRLELKRIEARREWPEGIWQQYLRFTEVDGVRYLDEGNGDWIARTRAGADSTNPPAAKLTPLGH